MPISIEQVNRRVAKLEREFAVTKQAVSQLTASSKANGEKLDTLSTNVSEVLDYVTGAVKVGGLAKRIWQRIQGPLIAAILAAGVLSPSVSNIVRAIFGLPMVDVVAIQETPNGNKVVRETGK